MLKKLNDMKVKPKLILCFVIVALAASLSGVIATVLMVYADRNYSNALVKNGFSQGEIGEFNTYLNKGSAVLRDVIILADQADRNKSQTELEQIQQKQKQALVDLKEHCNMKEEKEYISTIEKKLPEYESFQNQVIQLCLQGQNEEALELFHSKARPILNEVMTAAEELQSLNTSLGNAVSESLSRQSMITVFIIAVIIIGTIVISILFARYIAHSVAMPLIQVKEASEKLAKGDLNIEVEVFYQDEVGQMTSSFEEAIGMLKNYIEEIRRSLTEIAAGNFDISCNSEFRGDFKEIERAIDTIVKSMNQTLHQINDASEQVAQGATQMAENAQSLAEGATEQAGSVQELTATIKNVTNQVEKNAQMTMSAYQQASQFEVEAESRNEEMKQLRLAMDRISSTSKEIENIITEIEDIASQTNLLSLNASIEAARAGEAGKGFAVVADQIGKLAADSAKSAVNTRTLIGSSIQEVAEGNQITQRTSKSLEKVIEGIKLLAKTVKETSDMSRAQADTMVQIERGVEQISNVVQSNSASAEETSATSEELSAQSQNLKAMVDQFKLKPI